MDKRKALQINTELQLQGKSGIHSYKICKEIGRGGSSIVYLANEENNIDSQNLVHIKEFYPYKIALTRGDSELIVDEDAVAAFEKEKACFKEAFIHNHELFYEDTLAGTITNPIDIYEANNTYYAVTVYAKGQTLQFDENADLYSIIDAILHVAKIINEIHQAGYLYLDVKPDNIYCLAGINGGIQLFDFDSLVPINSPFDEERLDRLSFTPGFSPVEQRRGNRKEIGRQSDVYGIGALLYYLIFGKPADTFCGMPDCKYDFDSAIFDADTYPDKLCKELTEFFHNTLPSYYKDRYEDMGMVICSLEEILKVSDKSKPFLCSKFRYEPGILIGRESELLRLSEWAKDTENQCLILYGMPGIGKSTLARTFAGTFIFDDIVYLYSKNTLYETIADDIQLSINTIEKDPGEKVEEYCHRKLRVLGKILANSNSLIIIDDYAGFEVEELQLLKNVGAKILLVSDTPILETYGSKLELESFTNPDDSIKLFELYLGRELKKDEIPAVQKLNEQVGGHLYALESIAKQINRSYLTVEEACKLAENNGFTKIANEKIIYEKDYRAVKETVYGFFEQLFKSEKLGFKEEICVRFLSMLNSSGIDVNMLQNILELDSKDILNQLVDEGWASVEGCAIYMHPVRREVVSNWEWNSKEGDEFEQICAFLATEIALNFEVEEYPAQLLKDNQKLKAMLEDDPNLVLKIKNLNRKMKLDERLLYERIMRSDCQLSDYKYLMLVLQIVEQIIRKLKSNSKVNRTAGFKELLCRFVCSTPIENQEIICSYGMDLLSDEEQTNFMAGLKVLDKVAFVHEQNKNFEEAYRIIKEYGSRLAKVKFLPIFAYPFARYCDIWSQYYDARLNGEYWQGPEDDDWQKSYDYTKKAISYARKALKSKHPDAGAGGFLAESLISQANFLIRSGAKKQDKILALFNEAKDLLETYTLPYSQKRLAYLYAKGWYYTYVDVSPAQLNEVTERACLIAEKRYYSKMDYILFCLIPCANMYMEVGENYKASAFLQEAIAICEERAGIEAFDREKENLLGYLEDVLKH